MKICVAQTKPVKGSIAANTVEHLRLVDLAVESQADLIVFPELSLTGYEPTLAKELATHENDSRLDEFQRLSDAHDLIIGAGVPTKSDAGVHISMALFQPGQVRRVYSKRHLHADEEPFFAPGKNLEDIRVGGARIAFAICYEISILEHAKNAANRGADVYIASVAKFANGFEQSAQRLADIARDHGMTVMMANSVGVCDGAKCAGQSGVWSQDGKVLGKLDDTQTGIVLFDTNSGEASSTVLI